MNLPTIIVLLVVLAMAFIAIRILRMGKSSCSCEGNTKKPTHTSKCISCSADCPLKKR